MKLHTRPLVLRTAAVVVAAMLFYPPFAIFDGRITLNAGYHWFFDPPYPRAMISMSTLIGQFFAVGIITALLYFACGPRSDR